MKKSFAFLMCILMLCPMLFACGSGEETVIPQTVFSCDGEALYKRLYSLYVYEGDDSVKTEEAKNLLTFMKGYVPTSENAGGAGFEGKIYTDGDYIATDDNSFKEAVEKAKSGEVIFVPSGSVIDLADLYAAENYSPRIPEGVIIASDRGINQGGIIRFSHESSTLLICNANVTVTGINLMGVDTPSQEKDENSSDCGIRVNGENTVISNCEIGLFGKSGISLFKKGKATVSHCYIHHCKYGANDGEDGLTLEDNVFFANETDYENGDNSALPDGNVVLTAAETLQPLVPQVEPDIVSRVLLGDKAQTYRLLEQVAAGDVSKIKEAFVCFSSTDNYYYYNDKLTVTEDGKTYGISADKTLLGGGEGFETVHTQGDYTVTDKKGLINALREAKSGQVIFIPADAKIDIYGMEVTVPAGVTLASDRGCKNSDGSISKGGMLYTNRRQKVSVVLEDGATVTGLTLVGADTERHMNHLVRGFDGNGYTDYYYNLPLTRGILIKGDGGTVSNCEISGFSEAGILAEHSKDFKVYSCYIHHNTRNGYGYGVCLAGESVGEIYLNLFNFDRHAIAADGREGSGYSAHDNVHMGNAIYHIFDAHGGADRGDGTDVACDKVEMTNNVFLSDKIPYKKRGTPKEHSLFKNNIVIYPESYYPYRQMYGNNFVLEDNLFGIGTPEEIQYNFEGGKTFTLDLSLIKKHEGMEYIDAQTHELRYARILVFAPKGDGYVITEYGNNLDDGSIMGWNEKVYVPQGGFVLTFSSESTAAMRLYSAIEARYEVIYNTTLMLKGDFIAKIDGDKLVATQSAD